MAIIGTRRPEEAKVFDSDAGYHSPPSGGSIEVFWFEQAKERSYAEHMGAEYDADDSMADGWYWHACFPGCLPDGDPVGPFGSSYAALEDALGDDPMGDHMGRNR